VKFRLSIGGKKALDGVIDGIGATDTLIACDCGSQKREERRAVKDYDQAGHIILEMVAEHGAPTRIVHRIVHGGAFDRPVEITTQVFAELNLLRPLAPLHMTPAIALIRMLQQHTTAQQIACFDTMFHQSMPRVAKEYAIPPELAAKYSIHRYGFHGIAYQAMLRSACALIKTPPAKLRVIACQLGNGASVCAIDRGRSVDTSMGFTPLEGLVMGTRSGDVDPALIPFLCEHMKKTPEEVTHLLQHESGLLGLAGEWDVRKLLARERDGDKQAAFALDLFAYRVRKYIGAYAAVLGGVDLIILSGGVSRAPKMRERILGNMQYLGVALDPKLVVAQPDAIISSKKSKVAVAVIEVDEQAEMERLAKTVK
jgi:acetate kinase